MPLVTHPDVTPRYKTPALGVTSADCFSRMVWMWRRSEDANCTCHRAKEGKLHLPLGVILIAGRGSGAVVSLVL